MAHRLANRVKIVFDPPSILPLKFRREDLQNCWVQLPVNLPCISDFAEHLILDFELQRSCPRGILLQVDGFFLPPNQPLSLLKDDDTIRILKRKRQRKELSELEGGQCQTPLLSNSQAGIGGGGGGANVLLALTFPGPSASKDEDRVISNDHNDIEDNENKDEDGGHLSGGTKITGSSKKRKADRKAGGETVIKKKLKAGLAGSDAEKKVVATTLRKGKEVKNGQTLEEKSNVQGKGKTGIDKLPGKVKAQHAVANVVLKNNDDRTESSESSEESEEAPVVQKNKPPGKVKAQHAVANVVIKNDDDRTESSESSEESEEAPAVKKNQSKASKKTTSVSKEPPGSSSRKRIKEHTTNNGDTEGDAEVEKKQQKEGPSRSAKRKKAKRLWLRNQAEAKKSESNEQVFIPKSKPASNIVVKGHVRFGDEDGQPVEMPIVAPVLNLAPITSKRHGQAWGQQKGGRDIWQLTKEDFVHFSPPKDNNGQHGTKPVTNNKRVEEDDKERKVKVVENSFQNRDYESLPLFTGSPKIGNILAYQVVELTSSWAPELSPFREGRVTAFDAVSGQITFVPIGGPGTPIGREKEMEKKNDVDELEEPVEKEGESERDPPYPAAYEDDGTLQTEFSSLLNIRILETSSDTTMDEHVLPALGTVSTVTSNIFFSDKERVLSSETNTETNKIGSSILDCFPDISPPKSERQNKLSRLEDFSQLSRPSQTPPNTPLGQGFSTKEKAFSANQIMEVFAGLETVNTNSSMAADSEKYPLSPKLSDPMEVTVDELVDSRRGKGEGKEKEKESENENEKGKEIESKEVVPGAKVEGNRQEMSPWVMWADISRDLEKRRAELAAAKADTKSGDNLNKSTTNQISPVTTTKPIPTPEVVENKVENEVDSGFRKKASIQTDSPSSSKSVSTTSGKKVKGGQTGSLRTIRAAAMGPTLALLRLENSQSETKRRDN